ncbi:MAG: fibronectin type III domain-containing protein [Spirochaetales bacterium]|nr:fibronectin type III domain-containing protein [Spirochaetales bacterium]
MKKSLRKNLFSHVFIGIIANLIILISGCYLSADLPDEDSSVETPSIESTELSLISGDGLIYVSWEEVSGASSYIVLYSLDADSETATQYGEPVTETSTTITELTNGSIYYIWIESVLSSETSNISNYAIAIPVATPAPPELEETYTQINVNWTATAGAESYQVWYNTTEDSSTATQFIDNTTSTSVTITGLSVNTTYYVWIKAQNSYGISNFSNSENATTHNWTKIMASDGLKNDHFGNTVAICGDSDSGYIALIGAYDTDDDGESSGSAYIFTSEDGISWTEQQKLTASDASEGDYFGYSVDIAGNTNIGYSAIIGAALDDNSYGKDAGAAYVFRSDNGKTWTQTQKLINHYQHESCLMGISVSLIAVSSSNWAAVIGAPGYNYYGTASGTAFIYSSENGSCWEKKAKLKDTDCASYDRFGGSVSISGDASNYIVIIGSAGNDGVTQNSGAAYIYTSTNKSSWTRKAKLISNSEESTMFGSAVSITGTSSSGFAAIIGSTAYFDNNERKGSAYIFASDNGTAWNLDYTEETNITSDDYTFGGAVSISGNTTSGYTAIIGVLCEDDLGINYGTIYIYTSLDEKIWTPDEKITTNETTYNGMGNSVAICSNSESGYTAIAGILYDDEKGYDAGAAYSFLKE